MSKILNVPDKYELVCFLPIGIAAEPTTTIKKKSFIRFLYTQTFLLLFQWQHVTFLVASL